MAILLTMYVTHVPTWPTSRCHRIPRRLRLPRCAGLAGATVTLPGCRFLLAAPGSRLGALLARPPRRLCPAPLAAQQTSFPLKMVRFAARVGCSLNAAPRYPPSTSASSRSGPQIRSLPQPGSASLPPSGFPDRKLPGYRSSLAVWGCCLGPLLARGLRQHCPKPLAENPCYHPKIRHDDQRRPNADRTLPTR